MSITFPLLKVRQDSRGLISLQNPRVIFCCNWVDFTFCFCSVEVSVERFFILRNFDPSFKISGVKLGPLENCRGQNPSVGSNGTAHKNIVYGLTSVVSQWCLDVFTKKVWDSYNASQDGRKHVASSSVQLNDRKTLQTKYAPYQVSISLHSLQYTILKSVNSNMRATALHNSSYA